MTNNKYALIVDDSNDMLRLVQRHMTAMGWRSFIANNVEDAIDILDSNIVDIVITDLQMPGLNGEHLIKYINNHYASIPVVVITGYPSVENAVQALKFGAIEYIAKPFTRDEFEFAINSISKNEIKKPKNESENKVNKHISFHGILTCDKSIIESIDLIKKLRNSKASVLIEGESGTGKELVARSIHNESAVNKNTFIAVNCGAIPENLIESELFGYKKGSFTGANSDKIGLFEQADGGTLFLDEISNTTTSLQAKLLRAIQEKEILPIGSNTPKKIDVRIIAATNDDLSLKMEEGLFRSDLYFRLNVINITLPPLRERGNDIAILIEYFTEKYTKQVDNEPLRYSDEVIQILKKYSWPGNIRELQNLIQRLVIIVDEKVDIHDLPKHIFSDKSSLIDVDKWLTLKEIEKKYILKVLNHTGNNKSLAAKILGIDRKSIDNKLNN